MLIESIVRFTLGIKDHRVVSANFSGNELRIELESKKGRKLPCSLCGKRPLNFPKKWLSYPLSPNFSL